MNSAMISTVLQLQCVEQIEQHELVVGDFGFATGSSRLSLEDQRQITGRSAASSCIKGAKLRTRPWYFVQEQDRPPAPSPRRRMCNWPVTELRG